MTPGELLERCARAEMDEWARREGGDDWSWDSYSTRVKETAKCAVRAAFAEFVEATSEACMTQGEAWELLLAMSKGGEDG